MTVKEHLISLGMEEHEIENHRSDLYVKKNEISDHFVNYIYEYPENVEVFRDEIDSELWYNLPFAYEEYLED